MSNIQPSIAGVHRVYDFTGTAYEIGRQHGEALRGKIVEEFAIIVKRVADEFGLSVERFLNRVQERYEPIFRHRVPIGMEEVRGIAAGTGLTFKEAFFCATRDGLKRTPVTACTSFCCASQTTADGSVLLGQSKDTGMSTERYHIMRYAYDSGRRMVVLNYPGWIGNIGLTSDGMSLAGNSLYGQSPGNETVPYSLLKRLMLEKSSVREVLEQIDGLSFENGNFVLGDASGHLVNIESVAGRLGIRDVSAGAFGHANSILSGALKPLENETLGSPSSPTRQRNIQRQLDLHAGELSVDVLRTILKNHDDYPSSLCLHSHDGEPHHTTAAFAADLTHLTIDIAIGNPCGNPFIRYALPK